MTKTPQAKHLVVVGGGLAGMAAAMAGAQAGKKVTLIEKRKVLGGRAYSWTDQRSGEEIDNCQHVLLGCCVNVLDFLDQIGVKDRITTSRRFHYLDPAGKRHDFAPTNLPAPLHYLPALLTWTAIPFSARLRITIAFIKMMHLSKSALLRSADITMAALLERWKQPQVAIKRFWEPILVSAINEDLDRVSALPCLQVFLQGFMPHADAAAMGLPEVPLAQFCGAACEQKLTEYGATILKGQKTKALHFAEHGVHAVETAQGQKIACDEVILAIPEPAAKELLAGLEALEIDANIPTSPITSVHLWFETDTPLTDLEHLYALESQPLQWIFVAPLKNGRQKIQVVISASYEQVAQSQQDIITTCHRKLAGVLNSTASAKLLFGRVVKENRATIALQPGIEIRRPSQATAISNLKFAGDWTDTSWPSTLESAVRSGRLAAGAPLTPDLKRSFLAKLLLWRVPTSWPRIS